MAHSNERHQQTGNPFPWLIPSTFSNPMMSMLVGMNGPLMVGFGTAQRNWMEFVQRRISEDVDATRRLLNSRSLADVHEIYSGYLQTAFQDYRQQAEKVAQCGERFAQQFAESTAANAKEATRTRY